MTDARTHPESEGDAMITELTTDVQPNSQALMDLRSTAMASLSPAEMRAGLAKYTEYRQTFREWLLSQMKEGVHYGVPPGCEPKTREIDGVLHVGVWWKGKGNKSGEYRWYPETQWKPKPSLYKAGAEFVCDVLNVVSVYAADMDSWNQLGSQRGTFVFRCRLWPKGSSQTPETMVGEGWGVRKVGQKGGDENNAIKMAKKSALCDAVLSGYGLSDLFTQDIEDVPPPEYENPSQAPNAPQVPPRGDRITHDQFREFGRLWKDMRECRGESISKNEFAAWVAEHTALDAPQAWDYTQWTTADIDAADTARRKALGQDHPDDI